MKLDILTSDLKAAVLIAPVKELRYYLCGVHIRVTDEQMLIIESTDGHVAFQQRARYLVEEENAKGPFGIIVPLSAIKLAVKTKAQMLTLEALPDGRYMLGDVVFTAVDGKFPDIDRVMPQRVDVKECNVDLFQIDPALSVKAQDAMRLATNSPKANFRIQPAQSSHSVGAALMHCRDESFPRCAIMPLNVKNAFNV